MRNDFTHFCTTIANKLGLELCATHDPNKNNTMWSSGKTGRTYDIRCEFTNWSDERKDYYCELSNRRGEYLGAIIQEGDTYEHFEVAVSPTGHYLPHDMGGNPCDEDGNEIQGERHSYYRGSSLAWAAKSLQKGGSKIGRKPKYID